MCSKKKLKGSQVYTKIIRNGEEIGFLEKTKNFDVYGQVQWHTAGARKT